MYLKMINSKTGIVLTGMAGAALLAIMISVTALAQLSPGELSNPHASLEGVKNCTQCHDFQQKVSGEKCLTCHQALYERVRAGMGLHSRAEYAQCQECHIEHQGRDYQLIFWKDGARKFDHSLTGYRLEGEHIGLDCRKCHQMRNIISKNELRQTKINLDRTFLGLVQNCLSCHRDEHRGQFATACQSCHIPAGWKPTIGFDHRKTAFALTGKHAEVQCDKCHPRIVDNRSSEDSAYMNFTSIPHTRCLDCHQDAHNAKFGKTCETCHNTTGWKDIAAAQFDHSRTQFPLLGKHGSAACEKCHKPGQPLKGLKFAQCSDCHADYHQDQFTESGLSPACEKCHNVDGFSPSTFTIPNHARTDYPLSGSHLAVPCNSCHKKETAAGKTESIQFEFTSTRCLACHKDPHEGQADKYIQINGCEFCHGVDGWHQVAFDHGQTKFRLDGRHSAIKCLSCHKPIGNDHARLQFTGLPTLCQDCHQDIHQGQFADAASAYKTAPAPTECGRCHTPNSWIAERFDHNKDSAFKLDGAHARASCGTCHKKAELAGITYTVFRPLDMLCSSCHGEKAREKVGSGS